MKKVLSFISVIFIILSFISCRDSDDEDTGYNGNRSTEKGYPIYYHEIPMANLSLYFLNEVNDLPYVEIDDCVEFLKLLYQFIDKPAEFTVSKSGSIVTLVRKNKTYGMDIPATIDFEKNTIRFQDYDLFTMPPSRSTILDVTSRDFLDEQGQPRLIQKVEPKYLPRLGEPLELNLGSYGIDLPIRDGKYLIPLQTVSDIFVAPIFLDCIYFNGKSVIIASDFSAKGDQKSKALYYEGEHGERSAELTKFGYGELCLALDNLYGLKDHKEISSFDKLFQTVGSSSVANRAAVQEQSLAAYLLGSSVFTADKAIYTLIGDFLDDNHSKWFNFSYLTGEHDGYAPNGKARERLDGYLEQYKNARTAIRPDGIPRYEEIGDTAFITFDAFEMAPDDLKEYYADSIDELAEKDTIALIMKAHAKITRENSPIKNVVIDLSCNRGGVADTAVFVVAWYLEVADVSIKNTMTGAVCTTSYRCDANRDHAFDEKDTLGNRKLFCLASPTSFSCGNLVPSAFRESEKVTLLGRTSAGGACIVQPVSSAWGTCFRISGPLRLSYMKNGSYYDIDQGAEPDYTISAPENYYKREELVTFINSIK